MTYYKLRLSRVHANPDYDLVYLLNIDSLLSVVIPSGGEGEGQPRNPIFPSDDKRRLRYDSRRSVSDLRPSFISKNIDNDDIAESNAVSTSAESPLMDLIYRSQTRNDGRIFQYGKFQITALFFTSCGNRNFSRRVFPRWTICLSSPRAVNDSLIFFFSPIDFLNLAVLNNVTTLTLSQKSAAKALFYMGLCTTFI